MSLASAIKDIVPAGDELLDYAVEIRIRNARILGLMRRAGISTVTELARRTGIHPSRISEFINLKVTPLSKVTGDYNTTARRLAAALHCHPDDMFTARQRDTFMASNRHCVEMSEAEVETQLAALQHISPEEHVDQIERSDAVGKALARLTPRHRAVIIARYGLDGGPERSLEQIAESWGVSRERIRQMEKQAFRKLRHASYGLCGVGSALLGWDEPSFNADEFFAHQKNVKELVEAERARWKEWDDKREAERAEARASGGAHA